MRGGEGGQPLCTLFKLACNHRLQFLATTTQHHANEIQLAYFGDGVRGEKTPVLTLENRGTSEMGDP